MISNILSFSRWFALIALVLSLTACLSDAASTSTPDSASSEPDLAQFAASNDEAADPDPKASGAITTLTVQSASKRSQQNVPVTTGQPFVAGDVPKGSHLEAVTADGKSLPTQVDWKATYSDGSLRHGIITFVLPQMPAGGKVRVGLHRRSGKTTKDGQVSSPNFIPSDLNAKIKLDLKKDGAEKASLQDMLNSKDDFQTWLSGPLVKAKLIHGPLKRASGSPDPHLAGRFYVRHYPSAHRTRIEFIVENDWTFVKSPHNFTYDVNLSIDGQQVYQKKKLTQPLHTRWRKVYWVGGAPQVYVAHDVAYLKATGAIPNYDPDLKVPNSAVADWYKKYLKSHHGPLQRSFVANPMHMTGGRNDIGPLPTWTVLRVLTGAPRIIQVDNAISALGGSWPVHYRDKNTGQPVSIEDYPNISTHPNLKHWSKNPLSSIHCSGKCSTKLKPNAAHEPSIGFVPYLLTGDHYYLEELEFWAAWNPLHTSPKYRGYDKGLFKWTQVRGQAWSLRTLGQLAYITPDDAAMKDYWKHQLENNLHYYNQHYPNNPNANKLGFLVGLMPYHHGLSMAPWQDDFFTWAMGYLVGLGFEDAMPMLKFKARFPVGRMTAPGFCWIQGSLYTLQIRDSKDSPLYTSFAEVYKNSVSKKMRHAPCASKEMADLLSRKNNSYKAGDMYGYPWSPQGFPANMQPALAVAVNAGVPKARKAWKIFMNRTTKPDYSKYPNWDIVPRDENQ
jgi:hypothetical protein